MKQRLYEILLNAVIRNAGIAVSLPSAGTLRHHKSRFIGQTPHELIIEAIPTEASLVDILINDRSPILITLKSAETKIACTTIISGKIDAYQLSDGVSVPALVLKIPQDIKEVQQRRNNYRVNILPDSHVSLGLWRISERAQLQDLPMKAQELEAQIRNLSVGGVGVLVDATGTLRISLEDRLRIELTFQTQVLLMEGRIKAIVQQPSGEQLLVGIEFTGLQQNMEGRKILAQLTNIVGILQRDEIRRARIGMCG